MQFKMWILFVLLIVIAASCSCFYFQSLTTNKPEIPSAARQPYDPKIHGDLFNPEMSSPQVCESEPLFATTITEIQEDSEPLFATTITEIQEDSEPLFATTITEIQEDSEPLFTATITEIQEDSEPLFTATITEIQEDSEPLLTATITEIEEDEPLQINKKTKRIKANVKP
jgi:hypothetical protein